MQNKIHTITEYNPESFDKSVNEFCKNKKVFATQTHVLRNPIKDSDFTYIACIYYEFDEQLSNEKPRVSPYFAKPNSNLEPSKDSIPATANQVFSLVKYYGYSEEAAKKLSKHEAYQIIKEKKGRKK